ncbi:MAG: hypothetical protein CMM44_09240 [Rhodospirillaceae bacterium]|nr:hypothetical protein [Rhodospirillaceae bacterium]
MSDKKDYYAILGVLPSIEPAALSAVYKALIKKYHPDVYPGDKVEAERISRQINEAYETLGDEQKRAEYDGGRENNEGTAGDYKQETYSRDSTTAGHDNKIENWDYATEFYPDAEKLRIELNKFSPELSLTYQIILLEHKAFASAAKYALGMKEGFLERYFGSNRKVHEFVELAIQQNRRDVALEVNKAVKIIGSPCSQEVENFINIIKKKFDFFHSPNRRQTDDMRLPLNKVECAQVLDLINRIMVIGNKDTKTDMKDYKTRLDNGILEKWDLRYLLHLHKRLSSSRN